MKAQLVAPSERKTLDAKAPIPADPVGTHPFRGFRVFRGELRLHGCGIGILPPTLALKPPCGASKIISSSALGNTMSVRGLVVDVAIARPWKLLKDCS
jgi:hypothetical protein